MEKKNLVLIAAGLGVAGTLLGAFFGYSAGKDTGLALSARDTALETKADLRTKADATTLSGDHSQMTMDEMTKGLDGLSGDAFDKAFVEMMIVHHQGAVDMAQLIPAGAKHEELKRLGTDIITAQTKEIEMMKQWLKDWGYSGTSQKIDDGSMKLDHSM